MLDKSHLIMQETDTFEVKISVIPNGLEKYMAFAINKNLVFLDSMQFINSSRICQIIILSFFARI